MILYYIYVICECIIIFGISVFGRRCFIPGAQALYMFKSGDAQIRITTC